MKKYLFLSAVGAMMLAACTNDDVVTQDNPDAAQPGSELTISLNSSGDGAGSRAGRPVNSSEAANSVTAVKLYIYNSAGVDVTSTALAAGTQNPIVWTAGPTTPAVPGTDQTHKASQSIKLNKLSVDGLYTVVAYGYNALPLAPISDYTVTGGTLATDLFTATLPAATEEAELFAGKATFNVANGNIQTGTTTEVILHRHVAGLLAYFKNIPILYPNPNLAGVPTLVSFVRVYASSRGTAFTFPSTGLMNGTVATPGKTKVLEFNLATSILDFAAQVTAAGTNLLATFNIPIKTGLTSTVPNSVLSGKFLVPFTKTAATTFTVQLEDALGNTLKSWDVVNSAFTAPANKVYDVQRNYFYALGQKNQASSTNGGTSDPGSTGDDDAPIDLSQETVITVTVNDAWDVIYNLGIE